MKTTVIENFKTICKGSRLVALNLLKENNADIKKVSVATFKYLGKTVSYYNAEGKILAYLGVSKNKLELVIPSFSPLNS